MMENWSQPIDDDGLTRRDWQGERPLPLSVWVPQGTAQAIVLVGHGGSQHRRGDYVTALVRAVQQRCPAYVAALDGPVHGDRLVGGADDTRNGFIRQWVSDDGGIPAMVDDWKQALAAVRQLAGWDVPIGYYGVSMGTAYGIPLLAAEPAIGAAALGMWEADVGGKGHLLALAPAVQCAVQFLHRQSDPFFTQNGAQHLFDLLGTSDKHFVTMAGLHEESADQIDAAAAFLVSRLIG